MITKENGFTLLEILIAITIFAIVIGLAYASYNATFHITQSAESQTEIYAKARITLERIREDLESYYPGSNHFFKGTEKTLGENRADTLLFTSTAFIKLHPDSLPHGPIFIHYQAVEDPDSGALQLYRTILPLTTEISDDEVHKNALLLCDNLTEVLFTYQDIDGEWFDTWGQDETEEADKPPLPIMITVSLRFNDGTPETPGTLFKTGIQLPAVMK